MLFDMGVLDEKSKVDVTGNHHAAYIQCLRLIMPRFCAEPLFLAERREFKKRKCQNSYKRILTLSVVICFFRGFFYFLFYIRKFMPYGLSIFFEFTYLLY